MRAFMNVVSGAARLCSIPLFVDREVYVADVLDVLLDGCFDGIADLSVPPQEPR